jgi:hypothetical protein
VEEVSFMPLMHYPSGKELLATIQQSLGGQWETEVSPLQELNVGHLACASVTVPTELHHQNSSLDIIFI